MHTCNSSNVHQAQYDLNSVVQPSVRSHGGRIGSLNEHVNATFGEINSDLLCDLADRTQTNLDIALQRVSTIPQAQSQCQQTPKPKPLEPLPESQL